MSMYIHSVVFTYFLLMCLVFKCHNTVSFLDTKDSKFSLFEKNLMFTFKNDTEFFQTSKFSNNAIINRSSLASYEFIEFFENLLGLQLTGDFLFLPCLWISESPRTPRKETNINVLANRENQFYELHLGRGGGLDGVGGGFSLPKFCTILSLSLALLCRKSQQLYSGVRLRVCKSTLPARWKTRIKAELVRQKILRFYISSLLPGPDWYRNVLIGVGGPGRYNNSTTSKKVKQRARLLKAYSQEK